MNLYAIMQANRYKTYAVLLCYIVIFMLVGLLVDIIRINAPSLTAGFIMLLSLQAFPMVTLLTSLAATGIILYSLSRFSSIMLAGDEYEEIPQHTRLEPLQARVRNALDDVLRRASWDSSPALYLIHAPYMNAFASGWDRHNSLIAITSTLALQLNDQELKAVLAHELSHIQHGDVRLTMCVGVLSNILLLVCNSAVWLFLGGNRSEGAQKAKMILLIFQFVLPLLTLWLQMFLSRSREYMADAGSAYLLHNPTPLITALQKIEASYKRHDFSHIDTNPTRQAAYIFPLKDAFSTHPSIENRIKSLNNARI